MRTTLLLVLAAIMTSCKNYDTSISVGYQDISAKVVIKPSKNSNK